MIYLDIWFDCGFPCCQWMAVAEKLLQMTQRRGDGDAQHEPSVQRDDCWNTGTYPEQDVKTGNEHSCYLLIETLKHRKHDDKKKIRL